MKTIIRTECYEFSHDRAPRGRGGWAFAPSPTPMPEEIFWARLGDRTSLTYAEAKKAAAAHFTAMGEPEVYVLP